MRVVRRAKGTRPGRSRKECDMREVGLAHVAYAGERKVDERDDEGFDVRRDEENKE
jgi:hypothetical protein